MGGGGVDTSMHTTRVIAPNANAGKMQQKFANMKDVVFCLQVYLKHLTASLGKSMWIQLQID